jgi:hypothetical protein
VIGGQCRFKKAKRESVSAHQRKKCRKKLIDPPSHPILPEELSGLRLERKKEKVVIGVGGLVVFFLVLP